MRILIPSLLIITSLLGFNYFHEPYDRMLENTVKVEIYWEEGHPTNRFKEMLGHGSGVVLENGLILTAGHITEHMKLDNKYLYVVTKDGQRVRGTVVKSSMGYNSLGNMMSDLGIVKADIDVPGATLNCDRQEVGTKVYVSGNPSNLSWAITQGNVISVESRSGWVGSDWIKIDATTVGGNSGGPIYNRWGQVIGIISHGNVQGWFSVPIGLNFGVSAPAVCYFVESYLSDNESNS